MTYISALTSQDRKKVHVWERNNGRRVCKTYDAPYYFFAPSEDGEEVDLYGNKVTRIDFDTSKEFYDARKLFTERGIRLCESDIQAHYKVLLEHYHDADIGSLNVTFYDIEVDYDKNIGFSSPSNPYAPINSIAIYHVHSNRTVVLAVPPETRAGFTYDDLPDDIKDGAEVFICKNEKELLKRFFEEIEETDILCGWNSDFFDNPYVYERANAVLYRGAGDKLCFDGSGKAYYREVEIYGNINKRLMIHGRVTLDYLEVYKKFEMSMKPSYKLESVAEDELPHLPKISYDGSLYDLYRNDFEEFIRYNIRDTVILRGLEEKKKYIKLAVQMSHMATALIPDVIGTLKVAEMSIINFCHYNLGVRATDTPAQGDKRDEKYAGAIVIDPKPGLHEWIASLDIASLYPSAMRAINISPETIMGQFESRAEAFQAIRAEADHDLVFRMESSGQTFIYSAKKWKRLLKAKNWSISGGGTVFRQDKDGVIPAILTEWFGNRKKYKALMRDAANENDEAMREYYDRMQYIQKIQLNSMYGACGNEAFKFYDVRLAESTTLTGREILFHMARQIALQQDGEYDMEAECVLYGDTDSVYFATYEETADEAMKLADNLCENVNNSYPDFMRNSFNCSDGRENLIKAEQEIVSDRGIFIKKKYYILHVVKEDGDDKDKIKDMGVPIKKTTLPREIKEKLRSFIERLLKGEDWDIVGPEVVYFKDYLKERFGQNIEGIMCLGRPTGIGGIENYTERHNAQEPGLRVPGHVRAGMLWNSCLKTYNDLESTSIKSGDKIVVFDLKNPIGKFKSIAIPKDETKLPDWFTEKFIPLIDVDAQLEKLVDKPMKIMISAAGIKVPTKKKLKFEEGLFA